MEENMAGLKKASHCWWFDSHNSAKRSPWLQSTLSELEKKTKSMLNLIEGDADSFAQRAEMYYKKRPELVNMIEDFYRSYRYLAEQHELLRSEAASRRSTTLSKSDSDLTEVDDYPESEVSEIDNPESEDPDQIDTTFANQAFESIRKTLESKPPSPALISHRSGSETEHESAKSYKSKRVSYFKQMDIPFRKENSEGFEAEDLETRALFEKIVDDLAKLTSEIEGLRMEKEILMEELERKDEEKRQVIRQLSLTVEILKEENVELKKFIKDSKRSGSVFEFKKLKEAFSGTKRLFGLTARFQPALVAL